MGLEHDVIMISTSIMSVSEVVKSIPFRCLKRPTLFVGVLSVKEHPRQILLKVKYKNLLQTQEFKLLLSIFIMN